MSRLRCLTATVAVVVCVILAAPASADQPLRREVLTPPQPRTFPAGTTCPFAVTEEVTSGTKVIVFLEEAPGRTVFRITGHWVLRMTNESTAASVTVVDGGMSVTTDEFDVVTTESSGPAVIHDEIPVESLLYVTGRAVTRFERSGSMKIELVSHEGRIVDLCAALS